MGRRNHVTRIRTRHAGRRQRKHSQHSLPLRPVRMGRVCNTKMRPTLRSTTQFHNKQPTSHVWVLTSIWFVCCLSWAHRFNVKNVRVKGGTQHPRPLCEAMASIAWTCNTTNRHVQTHITHRRHQSAREVAMLAPQPVKHKVIFTRTNGSKRGQLHRQC